MEAIHIAPAAPPRPVAVRTLLSWELDVIAVHLRAGATLAAENHAFVLRAADGSIVEAAPRLDELSLILAAGLQRLPGRVQHVLRFAPALVAGYHATRWIGETLSGFVKGAVAREIERRRALLDGEEVQGHA